LVGSPIESWDDAEAALEQAVAGSDEPFDGATIINGRELLALARAHRPPPGDLVKGYWATFRVCWPDLEVEVFADHVESYRSAGQTMDIRHYPQRPGEAFSADLVAELAKLEA
jgi:hypothetical protein